MITSQFSIETIDFSLIKNPEKAVLIRAIDYFNKNIKARNFEYLMRDIPFDYSIVDLWYREQIDKRVIRVVVLTGNDEVCALAYLSVYHGRASHTAKLGVTVDPTHRRKGIARKICEELFQYGAAIGVVRIEALPMVDNEPAIKLLKKLGFVIEGVASKKAKKNCDRYCDCLNMAKLL